VAGDERLDRAQMARVAAEFIPDTIHSDIDESAGHRSDGKWAAVWVTLGIYGDPETILTPQEARALAVRLVALADTADEITSTAPE